MAYSKSAFAKQLGISTKELESRAKKAGFSNTEGYYNSVGGSSYPLIKEISKQVVELDRQIDELTPYLSLTDQEKQAFLDKAIEQITPYYERKKAEIEAGLKEGKVQTAEDILGNIKQVEEETRAELSGFDLTQAKTEEDFLNKIADITTSKNEDIAVKREDYRQRLENLKVEQIQGGTLTSGIGAKKRAEQERLKTMEESIIQRQADTNTQALETAKKYTIDQVALARQAAEQQRIRKIGTPSEVASTTASALQTAGLQDMSQLKSPEELARLRAERGIKPLSDNTLLPELQAEQQKAGIATQQELQADELARREATYGASITKIKAEQAKKASQLASLRGY
jgi:predicted transcriptional regulator